MKNTFRLHSLARLALAATGACAPVNTGRVMAPSAAEDSIRSIAVTTGGRVGVAALHVESGRRLEVDAGLPVFMSSVVKLPIAVQLLNRVDRAELLLDHRILLRPDDMLPGYSPLAEQSPQGVTLPVRELLRHAVSESDNTASDALLAYSGGADSVTARLLRLGVTGVRVDRGYFDYILDFTGTRLSTRDGWTRARLDSVTSASPKAARDSAAAAFAVDARDRATARALVDLLARLHRGELLADSSRALLLNMMTESNNPRGRIVAGVPPGTAVAHKTGTWGGIAVNDAGLVRLPDGTTLALALLARTPTKPVPAVDSALAGITRVIYSWATR